MQIKQIPRYHSHILKTPQSFIFEAIQISVSHESNSVLSIMSQALIQNLRDEIQFHLACDDSTTFIHKVTHVIRQQINHMHKKHLHFSNVTSTFDTIDRSRLLSEYHAQKLLDFLNQQFIIYQNDMIWFLYDEFDIVISQSMISRLLKEARYSRKIVQKVIAEHDEKLCSKWKWWLISWTSDQLVFLDESVACEWIDKFNFFLFSTLFNHANACSLTDWKYDWVLIDLSLHIIQSLKWLKRWSILSTFFINEYIAWKMHYDFIIKKIFLNFMWLQMLFICNSEEIELHSMMIMNNVKIHQSTKLNELYESFKMHLVKLSFYSSDYNFIENSFSVLKAWIKRNDQLVQWYDKFNKKFNEFLKVAIKSQRKWIDDSEALFHLTDIVHIFKWYLNINKLIVVKLIMFFHYFWIII